MPKLQCANLPNPQKNIANTIKLVTIFHVFHAHSMQGNPCMECCCRVGLDNQNSSEKGRASEPKGQNCEVHVYISLAACCGIFTAADDTKGSMENLTKS
jgi:hypothetical protein